MNTKTISLPFLALILASSVSAQVVLPGGRGNIYIGTPMTLPGPTANIVISPRISLPAPLLSPTIALTLAPVPVALAAAIPVLPIALPVAAIPQSRIIAERENIAIPFPALRAGLTASAPAKEVPAKDVIASREVLDNLFDNARKSDERGPVRSGRHISLPEHDLESEIGAY